MLLGKSRVPFFLEKFGTLLFTGLVLLDPSAGKLYPPTSLPLFLHLQPQRFSAYTQTSLPLRSLFPCHFCSSSPGNSQRPLKPRSPSVASSHAISAAPAPVTLSDRSNLAPRGRLLNENPSISEMLLGKSRVPFFLEKFGTLLFTGLFLLDPSAGKLYPPTSLPLFLPSPSDSQRTLKPRSPSVASSHAISAAPAPVTRRDRSNLAPPP